MWKWRDVLILTLLLGAGCANTDRYPERIAGNWKPAQVHAGGGQMRLDEEEGTIEEVAPGGLIRKGTYTFVKKDTIEVDFPEVTQNETTKKNRTRSRWPALKETRRIVSLDEKELVLAGPGWKIKYVRTRRFP